MINMIEDCEKCKYNCNDAFLGRIKSEFKLYNHFENVDLYLQTTDSDETAILLKSNGIVTLSAKDNADFKEISEFLNCIGYESVFFDGRFRDKLNSDNSKSGVIMICDDFKFGTANKTKMFSVTAEELSRIYDLVNNSFSMNISFADWFVDLSHKLRHGFSKIEAIKNDNKFVACAFSMFEYENTAVICSVCTDAEFRNNGYASACVESLVKKLKDSDINRFFVFCEDGEIVNFYKRFNFDYFGRWCENVR